MKAVNYDEVASSYDQRVKFNYLPGTSTALKKLARQSNARHILDLGCGTGRLTIPLARNGHLVMGIDLSGAMLDLAGQKLVREPQAIRESVIFLQSDMVNFDLKQLFDVILVSHNTLHEHPPGEIRRIICQIVQHLAKTGIVYLDLSNPMSYFAHDDGENVWIEDRSFQDPNTGGLLHQRSKVSIDSTNQQVRVLREHKYYEGEAALAIEFERESTYHLLYPHEIELLLTSEGLKLSDLYGGYNKEPVDESCQRLIVVARHRSEAV